MWIQPTLRWYFVTLFIMNAYATSVSARAYFCLHGSELVEHAAPPQDDHTNHLAVELEHEPSLHKLLAMHFPLTVPTTVETEHVTTFLGEMANLDALNNWRKQEHERPQNQFLGTLRAYTQGQPADLVQPIATGVTNFIQTRIQMASMFVERATPWLKRFEQQKEALSDELMALGLNQTPFLSLPDLSNDNYTLITDQPIRKLILQLAQSVLWQQAVRACGLQEILLRYYQHFYYDEPPLLRDLALGISNGDFSVSFNHTDKANLFIDDPLVLEHLIAFQDDEVLIFPWYNLAFIDNTVHTGSYICELTEKRRNHLRIRCQPKDGGGEIKTQVRVASAHDHMEWALFLRRLLNDELLVEWYLWFSPLSDLNKDEAFVEILASVYRGSPPSDLAFVHFAHLLSLEQKVFIHRIVEVIEMLPLVERTIERALRFDQQVQPVSLEQFFEELEQKLTMLEREITQGAFTQITLDSDGIATLWNYARARYLEVAISRVQLLDLRRSCSSTTFTDKLRLFVMQGQIYTIITCPGDALACNKAIRKHVKSQVTELPALKTLQNNRALRALLMKMAFADKSGDCPSSLSADTVRKSNDFQISVGSTSERNYIFAAVQE